MHIVKTSGMAQRYINMLPSICSCLTANRTLPLPFSRKKLRCFCETKLDSAHGWDIIRDILVIYDPIVQSHPAILTECLSESLIPCSPPSIRDQIFNRPYGHKRRTLLLQWLILYGRMALVDKIEHIWLTDPDILSLLTSKRVGITDATGRVIVPIGQHLGWKYLTPVTSDFTQIRKTSVSSQ